MKKPRILMEIVETKGNHPCHRGHKMGDRFDFDTQRGALCPMAMHTLFPYVDILRYGGDLPPGRDHGDLRVCCPDADVINVFKIWVAPEAE